MYLWVVKGRPVCQATQRCFCQGNTIYAQQSAVLLRFTKPYLPTNHTYASTFLTKTPIASFRHNKYEKMITMSKQGFSSSSESQPEAPKELSAKDKLKRAVKDYGATVIVFHVTISLMSLGTSYLVISSGVDVASVLEKIGFSSTSEVAAGASTFVVAYAVHKMFAPIRISITLGSTPFIVRYLRRIGFLKPPKST